jgi:hypothetical protein
MKEGTKKKNNYAFIDSQNVNLGISDLGWRLDWKKFRVYLRDKYSVKKAYLFIGYVKGNKKLYSFLRKAGYIIIFKQALIDLSGRIKGNIDAELVLHIMIELHNFDRCIIVTSDGDFSCLVKYLYQRNKLDRVVSPCYKNCSILLRKESKRKIVYMDNLRKRLEYKKKGPLKDRTIKRDLLS